MLLVWFSLKLQPRVFQAALTATVFNNAHGKKFKVRKYVNAGFKLEHLPFKITGAVLFGHNEAALREAPSQVQDKHYPSQAMSA
jgi:hypothetical protein